jgi:hypothetical protein
VPIGNSLVDFRTLRVKDDVVNREQVLVSKYIEYAIDSSDVIPRVKVYMSQYINENHNPQMCWISFLLDTFHEEKIWKRVISKCSKSLKNTVQSYESLVHYLFGPSTTIEQIQKRGVSFEDVKKFFEEFHFPVYIFDVNLHIRASYVPQKEQETLSVHFYFIVHNNHLYRLTNVQSIKHDPLGRIVPLKADYTEGLSGKFYMPEKKNATTDVFMVYSVDEAVELVLKSQKISLP